MTVVERESRPGGRAGLLERDGYRFDTGPTVLTMPELVADAFAAVGEDLDDWLPLVRLDPAYRAFFPDGSTLDVRADPAATVAEVEALCGPREAAGVARLFETVGRYYRYELTDFIDRNTDSPLDLVTPNLLRLLASGGFGSLDGLVRRHLSDPRTRRLFSFQALYAGLAPSEARALYGVITYMDSVAGVWFPRGGMARLPEAMAAAAAAHGVTFRYGTTVTGLERTGERVTAVLTADGERLTADAVVLNPDHPVALRDLLGRSPRRLRYSPSCALLLVGSSARYPRTAHHSLHFGRAWDEVFRELGGRDGSGRGGRLMTDPSVLVTNATRTDPTLAPDGRETYYVLFPTPNLEAGIDWRREGPRYRDEMVRVLEERGYVGFGDAVEVEDLTTPLDWETRGMAQGAPFAAAHTFRQTGPFRPGNLWGENVVLTGSGTRPGVGVPMVLVSGRLAAERVTGPDPAYRSRAVTWL